MIIHHASEDGDNMDGDVLCAQRNSIEEERMKHFAEKEYPNVALRDELFYAFLVFFRRIKSTLERKDGSNPITGDGFWYAIGATHSSSSKEYR